MHVRMIFPGSPVIGLLYLIGSTAPVQTQNTVIVKVLIL